MFEIGKAVLVFQTKMGSMPGKLRFQWTGLDWIIGVENGAFELGTLTIEILRQKVNVFRLTPYSGPTPPNPFKNSTELIGEDVGPLPAKSTLGGEPTFH